MLDSDTNCWFFCLLRRSKNVKKYIFQPFVVGAAAAFGMSVGALFLRSLRFNFLEMREEMDAKPSLSLQSADSCAMYQDMQCSMLLPPCSLAEAHRRSQDSAQ